MRVRFLADSDLDARIVRGLKRRQPEIDFRTSHEAALASLPDPEVLRVAAGEGRVLVTHDRRTMPGHFNEFVRNRTCSGVIIVPKQLPLAQVIDDLVLVWAASEMEEWRDRLLWLPL
jgi:hypothetical protein